MTMAPPRQCARDDPRDDERGDETELSRERAHEQRPKHHAGVRYRATPADGDTVQGRIHTISDDRGGEAGGEPRAGTDEHAPYAQQPRLLTAGRLPSTTPKPRRLRASTDIRSRRSDTPPPIQSASRRPRTLKAMRIPTACGEKDPRSTR